MRHITKNIIIFAFLVFLNFFAIQKISIAPISIESFFPHESSVAEVSFMENNQRMLFASSEDAKTLTQLQGEGKIRDIISVSDSSSMILYPESELASLLERMSLDKILGPPVVGQILSKEFVSDIQHYLYFVMPVLFLLFLVLTSLKYLFSIVTEMLLLSFFFLSGITLFSLEMNISFLLSLVFIYIYGFTILNYFYYGEIQKNHLLKGIVVSLLTTMLSAWFLAQSDFMVISDFGKSLLIWIGILSSYLMLRSYIIPLKNWHLQWLDHIPNAMKIQKYLIVGLFVLGALTLLIQHKLTINLNPISVSKSSTLIRAFEKKQILSQPVLLNIESKRCSLKNIECIEKLIPLLDDVIQNIPLQSERIIDFTTLYEQKFDSNISDINQEKLSQFYLALEFITDPGYLISADAKETFMLFSISMQASTDELSALVAKIDELNQKYLDFSIKPLNHLANVQHYKEMFVNETFIGMLMMLGILMLVFIVYYQKIAIVIVFIPAFLTLSVFFCLHILLMIPISLMSLIALILFMGLIADNIIHVFICYKKNGMTCFGTIYKPIILSNILMILAFFGMMFTGSFLEKFGWELGFLLLMHLLFLVYLLPGIVSRYLKI